MTPSSTVTIYFFDYKTTVYTNVISIEINDIFLRLSLIDSEISHVNINKNTIFQYEVKI